MKKKEKLKKPINLGIPYEAVSDTSIETVARLAGNSGINTGGRMNCKRDHEVYWHDEKCNTIYYKCNNPDTNFSVNITVTNCGTGDWHFGGQW